MRALLGSHIGFRHRQSAPGWLRHTTPETDRANFFNRTGPSSRAASRFSWEKANGPFLLGDWGPQPRLRRERTVGPDPNRPCSAPSAACAPGSASPAGVGAASRRVQCSRLRPSAYDWCRTTRAMRAPKTARLGSFNDRVHQGTFAPGKADPRSKAANDGWISSLGAAQ